MKLRKLGQNMHELETGSTLLLFSYETPVAVLDIDRQLMARVDPSPSRTSSKHVTQWLGGNPPGEVRHVPPEWFEALRVRGFRPAVSIVRAGEGVA